jgi:hypothetical protein
MVVLTPIERQTLHVCLYNFTDLNLSTFGNKADVYATVHLVPHACQHITIDHICYYRLLAANQGNYVRGLFLKNA